MYKENQPLKTFLYTYTEFYKFLQSISKKGEKITTSMLVFMIHAYSVYLESKKPMTKRQFLDERFTASATFFRLWDKALENGYIIELENGSMYKPKYELPYHLRLITSEVYI